VLREDLLEEATRLSGEKTYSAAVEMALDEFVRRAKARQILSLAGLGLWEGNLGSMRADTPPTLPVEPRNRASKGRARQK